MNKLKYVSFYTEDTIYEEVYNSHLLPSLKRNLLSYWVKGIKNKGSWAKNTIQKPAVILEALKTYPKHDIVWVDADVKIKEYPLLLGIVSIYGTEDIGVHYLDWYTHYGRESDKGKTELIDGTIFIRNNKKMVDFVTEWKKRSTDIGVNHQRVLEKMIKEKKDIKCYNLPRTYCYIMSTPHGKLPKVQLKRPVICHYQASRKAKRNLKKEE